MADKDTKPAKPLTEAERAWEAQYGKGEKMPPGGGDAGFGEKMPGPLAPAEREDDETRPTLTLYRLSPKDRQEPPFHFAGVPQVLIVAATSPEKARHFAADADALGALAWLDDKKTDCVELDPDVAGVVARDMSA